MACSNLLAVSFNMQFCNCFAIGDLAAFPFQRNPKLPLWIASRAISSVSSSDDFDSIFQMFFFSVVTSWSADLPRAANFVTTSDT